MFTVQTDMTNGRHSQPLFWTGSEVVGILRANEALTFSTREEAEEALSQIEQRKVRFYGLVVVAKEHAYKFPILGNNGWMVRHPGYDSMH